MEIPALRRPVRRQQQRPAGQVAGQPVRL